jgi:hypothetical protein
MQEVAPGIKNYTAAEMLQKTEASLEARRMPGSGKKKQTRIWRTRNEYVQIRSGPTLPSDPDDCVSSLQERTLTLFKHIDPNVVFASDPKRPLYKVRNDCCLGLSHSRIHTGRFQNERRAGLRGG